MLVQFDDDTGRLTPVEEPLAEWRYANFHVDGALVERYNGLLEEFEAVRNEIERIQRAHEVRRYRLGEEWAREKLAALHYSPVVREVEWTTWQGKRARLYTVSDGKSTFLLPDISVEHDVGHWLGYLPNGRDHVLIGLTQRFFWHMEAEWMQKLIAPPQGSQGAQEV